MATKTKPDFRAVIAKEIPQAGAEFEKALSAAEKALAEEKKSGDLPAIDNCMSAIKSVGAAVERAMKANRKDKDAVAFLKKFELLVASELKRLEAARKAAAPGLAEDEEPSDERVLDPNYLGQCIKVLRNRELNFACGVHKNALQCRIIFDKKKAPKRLFELLKTMKELDLATNRLTFGKACADAGGSNAMVLMLDEQAEQPMGLIKKMRTLLRKKEEYRPFRDLRVMVGGRFVDDIPDPMDTEPEEPDTANNGRASSAGDQSTRTQADSAGQQFLKKKSRVWEARELWMPTRLQARKNVLLVKAALRKAYRRDATQLPLVMQKAKALDAIVDGLSDELGRGLDRYLKAPATDVPEIGKRESEVNRLVREIAGRINQNALLAAIDEDQDLVPQLKIKAPLLDVLQRVERAIAG